VAVFDWEMATLGDPRADLGWMLSYWRDAKDPAPEVPDLATRFMEREDYPSRQDLVARWEDRTGLTFTDERFYRALAVYKLAGLGEMFYRRHLEGNADDPMYPKMEERVPALADRAVRIVEGDEPL
jgi:aminoglycoside phosphotransferase (APT) family kinase protein